ncbi:CRISPR-associated protein [Oceanisphaera profunda]|uniref:CRISPR-associated protein n=1 Tax=Oceanisphaera profunda TaxID=1416627 RepID=A0A1Y0D7A4_9GAMM|nr:CRISPR-associated ring nuclease Csm6 [Oceanisphaera profunda]ART83428.1 CRISPR-associated protein [Oceanisphaera profunda]
MRPEEHPEKVLLISVGTSPQIITEVIYALTVQRQRQQLPMFMPSKIVVVSTTTGIIEAKKGLDGANGYYTKLAQDYHLTDLPTAIDYQTIVTSNNEPLDDIRNSKDNADAADFIANIIRQYTSNDNCALHVSIAGGRKTQGYYTGFALSLFGRPKIRCRIFWWMQNTKVTVSSFIPRLKLVLFLLL